MNASISASAPVKGSVLTRGVLFVSLANAFFFLAHTGSFPTMPVYLAARGANEADIAGMIGLVGLVSLLTRPISGWLIDSLGRRTMMLAGAVAFATAILGYGYAATLPLLAMVRVVHGTVVGIVSTAANAYVSDAAPADRRAEALGYAMAIQTTAGSVGPTLFYSILTAGGFAAWNAFGAWWPELSSLPGGNYQATLALMLVSLIIAFGLALLAPNQPRPASVRRPNLSNLVDRRSLVPLLVMITGTIPFICTLSFLPFFGPERGLTNVGFYFTFQAVGAFLAGLTLGRIADRAGRKPVVVLGLFGAGLASLLLSVVDGGLLILALGLLSGYTQAGARNAITALAVDHVPSAERGSALSTLSMGFDVGIAIGGPILGQVALVLGIPAAFALAGLLSTFGGVSGAVFLRESRRVGE